MSNDTKIRVLKSRGLGRGLSALIQDTNSEFIKAAENRAEPASDSELSKNINISQIKAWKFQPRTYFNEEELNELAESIRKNGVVQPILVRKSGSSYEIIAGERRWRAASIASLAKIPAIIIDVDDKKALEIALVENIQRQNLMPLEVAEGYKKLIEEYSYTQEELSDVVGKSRTQVTNFLRLLALPEDVKELLNKEKISFGHAKALLAANDSSDVASRIVKRGLNVRQTESLVKKLAEFPRQAKPVKHKDSATADLEKTLSSNLGVPVSISGEGGKGKITLSYSNVDQLDSLLKKLAS